MNTAMKEQQAIKRDKLREEAHRKRGLDKFEEDYTKLHTENIEGHADFMIGAIQQFFDGFSQPSKREVDHAMIYGVSDEHGSGVEYSLKAGGGSISDELYEALIKVDGVAIYKKYSTDFDTVLISEDELVGLIRPLVPTSKKVENIVHHMRAKIFLVAKGRFDFEKVDWELGEYDFVSTEELLLRIESKVQEHIKYLKEDNPVTREGCLEKYDWEWMDKGRIPELIEKNKKWVRWGEKMPAIFEHVKEVNQ